MSVFNMGFSNDIVVWGLMVSNFPFNNFMDVRWSMNCRLMSRVF